MIDIEALSGNIEAGQDILAVKCRVKCDRVMSTESDPSTGMNPADEGHPALYQLKIALQAVVGGLQVAEWTAGDEFVGRLAIESRQAMGGVDGQLKRSNPVAQGGCRVEETAVEQQVLYLAVEALHTTIAPRLVGWDEQRLDAHIQSQTDDQAEGRG